MARISITQTGSYNASITVRNSSNANVDVNNVQIGDQLTITASVPNPWMFLRWRVTADGSSTNNTSNPFTLTVSAEDTTVQLTCVKPTLYVGAYMNDGGWTTSVSYTDSSEAVDMSGVDVGRELRVEAVGSVASTGYAFDHWVLQMSGNTTNYTNNPMVFHMPSAHVTLQYVVRRVYSCTASSANTSQGTASVTGNGYAAAQDSVTATASPKFGYTFDYWEYTGSSSTRISKANPLNITMPSYDVTFVAHFKRSEYTVTVTGETGGNPAFSDGETQKTVQHGTKVTVVANPATGYIFKEWSISMAGDTAIALSETNAITIIDNTTITCKYQKQPCDVSISNDGNGTATFSDGSTSKRVDYGTQVTITATPKTGYHFSKWSFDNGSSATTATYSFEVKRTPIEIVAVFAQDNVATYSVTISHTNADISSTTITAGNRTQTKQGSVSQNLMSGIESGTRVSVSATLSDGGYTFSHWTATGLASGMGLTSNPYSFYMPSNDVTFKVVDTDSHAITFSNDAQLTATFTGEKEVTVAFTGTCTDAHGDDIVFTFYKGGTLLSGNQLKFNSGHAVTVADACKRTVTLTDAEMERTSIMFQVFAECSTYSGHYKSIYISFDPQSGSGEQGSDEPGDEPGGDTPGGGSVVVNSGYGLYYWDGTEWIGIIPIALENGGVTNGE